MPISVQTGSWRKHLPPIPRSNVPPAFNLVHTNTNFSANGKVGENTSLLFQDPFVSISLSNDVALHDHLANMEPAFYSVRISSRYNPTYVSFKNVHST